MTKKVMKSLAKWKKRKVMIRNEFLKLLTIEESDNNDDEESSLPTCENQTLLPPSLQVREKLTETSSVLKRMVE